MKIAFIAQWSLVGLLALAGVNIYGQTPENARSRTEETLEWWNHVGDKLIAMAKDFPETDTTSKFRKTSARSARICCTFAAVDYDVIGRVTGSHVGPDFGANPHNPPASAYKTKAEVVRLLEQAVAEGAALIERQGDAGLDKTMDFAWEMGRHVSRVSFVWETVIEHSAEHFGQLVVYYRANGLVPPESRR